MAPRRIPGVDVNPEYRTLSKDIAEQIAFLQGGTLSGLSPADALDGTIKNVLQSAELSRMMERVVGDSTAGVHSALVDVKNLLEASKEFFQANRESMDAKEQLDSLRGMRRLDSFISREERDMRTSGTFTERFALTDHFDVDNTLMDVRIMKDLGKLGVRPDWAKDVIESLEMVGPLLEEIDIIEQVLREEDTAAARTQLKELHTKRKALLGAKKDRDLFKFGDIPSWEGLDDDFQTQNILEFLGVESPQFDFARTRADARVARSMQRMSGEPLPEGHPMRAGIEKSLVNVERYLEDLHTAYEEQRAIGTEESLQVATEEIAPQISSAQNLRAELTAILDKSTSKQEGSLNKVLGFVSTTLSTLGVTSLASRFILSEPFQYETRPQYQIMGQQGEIGGLLSRAGLAADEHALGLDQTATSIGGGLLAGGLATWMSGRGAAGMAMSGIGTLIGAAGLSGTASDILRGIGFSTSEDDVMAQSMATELSDTSRLVGRFQSGNVGLMAAGATGPDMGFVPGSRSGNVFVDDILDGRDGLRALGHNTETLLPMMTSAATSMRAEGSDLTDIVGFAASLGGFGVDPDSALAALTSAQRAGSQNVIDSYSRYAGVYADEDGSLDAYSMNVLVPALMKVSESTSVRQLARSSEELESSIVSFAQDVVSGDSVLAERAMSNPEILGRIIGSLQGVAEDTREDPSKLAFAMSLGIPLEDIVYGNENVGIRIFEELMIRTGVTSGEDLTSTVGGLALLSASPFSDPNITWAMAEVIGGKISSGEPVDIEEVQQAIKDRVGHIAGTDLGTLAASMSEQTDKYLALQSELIPQLLELQESVLGFLASPELLELIRKGLEDSADKTNRMAGVSGVTPADIPGIVDTGNLTATPSEYETRLQLRRLAREGEQTLPTEGGEEFSTGGFTGMGGRHSVAGVVHAGEYVISSDKVPQNREVLDRIQGGESMVNQEGDTTYVTIKIHGNTTDEILARAQKNTEEFIVRNRIHYA